MLNTIDRLLFIRQVPIFKELRDDFIVRLASVMEELSFPANYNIFKEGDQGRSLYIVVAGTVKIYIANQQLAVFSRGESFGEMAVFDTQQRSASATTIESCICLELTQEQLYDAIEETPEIAVNIIGILSRRIRELNDKLNPIALQSH